MELYFATERTNGDDSGLTDAGYAIFLREIAPNIERICDSESMGADLMVAQRHDQLEPY